MPRHVALALALLITLTACGQTGDLYLPDPKAAPAPETPPTPAAPAESDEERKNAP